MDILFVCTANQCRSAMAEAMLRRRLESGGIEAHVHSAGLLEGGQPMTDETLRALTKRGLDGSIHESRKLTPALVQGADLVLAMTRRHLADAARHRSEDWKSRVFTLKELVRRGYEFGPRSPGQPLDEWLRKVGATRDARELIGDSALDDVSDPVTEPDITTFERAADEIEGLISRFVRLIWVD
jgi:protein-tyrosine phosphatase